MATQNEQLQAMRRLAENWDGYGAAPVQSSLVDLAQEFVALIKAMLKNSSIDPDMLHVSPTRVGGVLIEWEDRSMQHEVEINPDQSISFLHLNQATGQIETRKFFPDGQAVVQRLRNLLADDTVYKIGRAHV